jgi:cobalamin synthase
MRSWTLVASVTAEVGQCTVIVGAGLLVISAVAALAASDPSYKDKQRTGGTSTTGIATTAIGALLVLMGTVGFGGFPSTALGIVQSATLLVVVAFTSRVMFRLWQTRSKSHRGPTHKPKPQGG